ncbi:hypothetical protein MSPP1_000573 [Malassezia sp. CBS 17886]|nr:hypothetical protein MSPP1_000573 [Malassezia sp. CBS 17886]
MQRAVRDVDAIAWQTPTPRTVRTGILRSPRTPGSGSSVRFGMRAYDDGEESVLTVSHASLNVLEDVDERVGVDVWGGGGAHGDAALDFHEGCALDRARNASRSSHASQLSRGADGVPGLVLPDGESMEMSFTESFLKREVGDALAGLDAGTGMLARARPVPSQLAPPAQTTWAGKECAVWTRRLQR